MMTNQQNDTAHYTYVNERLQYQNYTYVNHRQQCMLLLSLTTVAPKFDIVVSRAKVVPVANKTKLVRFTVQSALEVLIYITCPRAIRYSPSLPSGQMQTYLNNSISGTRMKKA